MESRKNYFTLIGLTVFEIKIPEYSAKVAFSQCEHKTLFKILKIRNDFIFALEKYDDIAPTSQNQIKICQLPIRLAAFRIKM